MNLRNWISGLLVSISLGAAAQEPTMDLEKQVADHERAFARTMADRDAAAFAEFVSTEGVFLSGPGRLVGREAVVAAWGPYFEGETPPFSWEPETVVVLESGSLALSTGPVLDPEGNKVAIFTTTWRQEEPGVWRVVFDRGNKACGE
ncbi:MAG: nuclear transport factor 2 family protein [Xanthomonadales bacterium]|nr:nuclear transport factor 2 family protein [Gammaproteobacteria bacterium]NNK51601.1 nuclear transport factor 2 family protein [Xanthomonadales bacterium]